MRISTEERKELDEWVEKEYPKSIRRMELSSPFHRIGKYLIIIGILAYASFVIFDFYFQTRYNHIPFSRNGC